MIIGFLNFGSGIMILLGFLVGGEVGVFLIEEVEVFWLNILFLLFFLLVFFIFGFICIINGLN